MEWYLRNGPERRGYRKRMHDIWKSKDIFEVKEQKLMDQIRQIKKNKWLSNLAIEKIKRRIEEEVVGQGWNAREEDKRSSGGSRPQRSDFRN